MSDAIPLPSRPNLEQYKKLARDLQDACKTGTTDAVRDWAARWFERLDLVPSREVSRILERWGKLKEKHPHIAKCTLTGAQFFVAREHGFISWPKFARHVEGLARANSPVSVFEAAADAIITGDVE